MSSQKEGSGAGTPNPSITKHRGKDSVISSTLAESREPSKHQTQNTILLAGVDTLELTIGGMVSPSKYYYDNYELWEQLKSNYQSPDKYFTVEIGNRWFQLYPVSSGSYCFQLRNDEFGFIKVFHPKSFSAGCSGKQQIHLKLFTNFIHSIL